MAECHGGHGGHLQQGCSCVCPARGGGCSRCAAAASCCKCFALCWKGNEGGCPASAPAGAEAWRSLACPPQASLCLRATASPLHYPHPHRHTDSNNCVRQHQGFRANVRQWPHRPARTFTHPRDHQPSLPFSIAPPSPCPAGHLLAPAPAAGHRSSPSPAYVRDAKNGSSLWRLMVPEGAPAGSAPKGLGDGAYVPMKVRAW